MFQQYSIAVRILTVHLHATRFWDYSICKRKEKKNDKYFNDTAFWCPKTVTHIEKQYFKLFRGVRRYQRLYSVIVFFEKRVHTRWGRLMMLGKPPGGKEKEREKKRTPRKIYYNRATSLNRTIVFVVVVVVGTRCAKSVYIANIHTHVYTHTCTYTCIYTYTSLPEVTAHTVLGGRRRCRACCTRHDDHNNNNNII